MPEGHTIHRLARDHTAAIAGRTLRVGSPQGRFKVEARRLDGLRLKSVEAAGKHLFYHFTGGLILHVHLGLFGKFRTHTSPPPAPRGAVRVRFAGAEHTVDLNGPNQCELIDAATCRAILARLGPDPLRDDADPKRAWRRVHASRAPVGLLLMDQTVVAGIGNIYRSEILHLVGVHPRTPGSALTRPQFDRIWKLAVRLLRLGVEHNRIITVDLRGLPADVARVPRRKLFMIYKKPACPACDGPIEQFTLGGRNVFACPACQVPHSPAGARDQAPTNLRRTALRIR